MKLKYLYIGLFFILIFQKSEVQAWGFWSHKRINRMAVFTLPADMLVLYKAHISYITEHAVDPDKRRYAVDGEEFRHYIDLDHWGELPFENLPLRWTDVLAKYTEVYAVTETGDTLLLMGEHICGRDENELTLCGETTQQLWGKEEVKIDYQDYRKFCQSHFSIYEYDEKWSPDADEFLALFGDVEENIKITEIFAIDKFTEYGVVAFHIPREVRRLTKAFKEGNVDRIIKISADLGHYVGDAHVPLHTTENYNGQMTNQKGIHGFWESRLPELFAKDYNFLVGKAWYIEDVQDETWKTVFESHRAVDSVLGFEQILNDSFPEDKKYGYETRNNLVVRAYSKEYSGAYHDMLNGQVERRMRKSIRRVGAFWYTAWKNADSPDLKALIKQKLKTDKKEKRKKRNQKLQDREN